MARMSFGAKAGRVSAQRKVSGGTPQKSPEEVVRELKAAARSGKEDYRDRSLAIHGLICARCGREFEATSRHLLTVHHRDHDHHNNPPDGSNWENLCVYCHDDAHSRQELANTVAGTGARENTRVVHRDEDEGAAGGLGALLAEALRRKQGK